MFYAGYRPISSLVLQENPQNTQLFCIRIPAFCSLCSSVDSRLNGLGAFLCNRFDQSKFVGSICLRSPEGGDEFGMGNGWIHKDLIESASHRAGGVAAMNA